MGSLLVVLVSVTSATLAQPNEIRSRKSFTPRPTPLFPRRILSRIVYSISLLENSCALYIISAVQILVRPLSALVVVGRGLKSQERDLDVLYASYSEKGNNPCSTRHSAEAEAARHMSVAGAYTENHLR